MDSGDRIPRQDRPLYPLKTRSGRAKNLRQALWALPLVLAASADASDRRHPTPATDAIRRQRLPIALAATPKEVDAVTTNIL